MTARGRTPEELRKDPLFEPTNPATWPDFCCHMEAHPLTGEPRRCRLTVHDVDQSHEMETA